MKLETLRIAVDDYEGLRKELQPVADLTGREIKCIVRQKDHGVEDGLMFREIGIAQRLVSGGIGGGCYAYSFWGKLRESVELNGELRPVTTKMYLDPDSIDSIEFEVYEPAAESEVP